LRRFRTASIGRRTAPTQQDGQPYYNTKYRQRKFPSQTVFHRGVAEDAEPKDIAYAFSAFSVPRR
jgi:hypothetical protein